MEYLGVRYRIVSRLEKEEVWYFVQERGSLWGWKDVPVRRNTSYLTGKILDPPTRCSIGGIYYSLQDTDLDQLERRYRNMRSAEHAYMEAEYRRLEYGTKVEKA